MAFTHLDTTWHGHNVSCVPGTPALHAAPCFHRWLFPLSPCWSLTYRLERPVPGLLLLAVPCTELAEKAMATHSSTLAWRIPGMEEPGGPQSMGSLRVAHDWATSLSLFPFMHWRRKWQPTPVCLPGESQGWGSLVGCRLWGLTESDTTEAT